MIFVDASQQVLLRLRLLFRLVYQPHHHNNSAMLWVFVGAGASTSSKLSSPDFTASYSTLLHAVRKFAAGHCCVGPIDSVGSNPFLPATLTV